MIAKRVVSGSSSTIGVFSRMIDSYGSSGGLHIRHIFGPNPGHRQRLQKEAKAEAKRQEQELLLVFFGDLDDVGLETRRWVFLRCRGSKRAGLSGRRRAGSQIGSPTLSRPT